METDTQEAFEPQWIINGAILDITFNEFLALPKQGQRVYIHVSKSAKPKDHFGIGDLFENYLGPVKDAQEIMSLDKFDWNNAWELIGALKGIDKDIKDDVMWAKWKAWEKQLGNEKFFNVALSMRWLIGEIEKINKIESMNFNFKPDGDMIAAGLDKLSKYGATGQIDSLCEKWGQKPEEIRKMKYSEALRFTLYHKDKDEFTSNYQKIVMNNMKRKGNGN